ncbi:MAG TPA: hypothetical protein VKP88_07660 [Candidatus Paceibacterota bacterium]|nr:hypothetical protein [Candidatus Paceibacterota bacterium]
MTADEFSKSMILYHAYDRFIAETYSVRCIPYTPWDTSPVEDFMLQRAGIIVDR